MTDEYDGGQVVAWAKPGEGKTSYDNLGRGVYRARFGYIDEKARATDKRPAPYAILKFEVDGREVPMSLDIGAELAHVIWQLTGVEIESSGVPDSVVRDAIRALANCTWEGLVYVGGGGFIERLQVPDGGGYTFMFAEWQTRRDGQPGFWIQDGKRPYPLTVINLVVDGGDYDGYFQSCIFPCKFDADDVPPGKLSFRSDGLVRVFKAAGLTPERLDGEIVAAGGLLSYFADVNSPFPEIEALLQILAGEGCRMSGAVEEGNAPWGSLYPASGKVQTVKKRKISGWTDDFTLRELLAMFALKLWPNRDIQVFEKNGDLTNYNDPKLPDGLYLGRNLLKPITETVDGAIAKWPPKEWPGGQQAIDAVCEVVRQLLALGDDDLFLLVADSPSAKENLKQWIADRKSSEQSDTQEL